jgi:hypothetical protein
MDCDRRTKEALNPADTMVSAFAKDIFIARLMTGSYEQSLHLSPWPETRVSGLNEMIQRVWVEATEVAGSHGNPLRGASAVVPPPAARKVCQPYPSSCQTNTLQMYDQISMFRTDMMKSVRSTVALGYPFLEETPDTIGEKVEALLVNDDFIRGGTVSTPILGIYF